MKCLPQSKVAQAKGIVLHDWHAEILAIRSFNRFLLDECYSLASAQKDVSDFIRLRTPDERSQAYLQPFTLKDDIVLHMYCSEAPCRCFFIDLDLEDILIIRQVEMPAWNLQWPLKMMLRHGTCLLRPRIQMPVSILRPTRLPTRAHS